MASDADVVVLGLLAECPRHGYDLDRVIDQRGYREWTSLAFSSIYYVLKRLADRGLIKPAAQSEGRRTVFQLTDAGEQELREAAAERISRPDPPSASALPALGAYAHLDDPALLAALRQRIDALTRKSPGCGRLAKPPTSSMCTWSLTTNWRATRRTSCGPKTS